MPRCSPAGHAPERLGTARRLHQYDLPFLDFIDPRYQRYRRSKFQLFSRFPPDFLIYSSAVQSAIECRILACRDAAGPPMARQPDFSEFYNLCNFHIDILRHMCSHRCQIFHRYGTERETKIETHFCDATERYIFSPMGKIVRASRWRAHPLLYRGDVDRPDVAPRAKGARGKQDLEQHRDRFQYRR